MKGIALIGIDCATKAKNIGLALGRCGRNTVRIEEAGTEAQWDDVVEKLRCWISDAKTGLLALDAPLGWPIALRSNLRCHKAGKALKHSLDAADKLFFRQTDLEMIERYDKRPLDIGANFIARTAHAALALLGELREKTGEKIHLAWTPGMPNKTQAIEVYPAATLIAYLGKGTVRDTIRKIRKAKLSKEKANQQKREEYLQQIRSKVAINAETEKKMIADDNVFDAVLCVLAAADFVRKQVVCPENYALAKKEGWIWVKKPE